MDSERHASSGLSDSSFAAVTRCVKSRPNQPLYLNGLAHKRAAAVTAAAATASSAEQAAAPKKARKA